MTTTLLVVAQNEIEGMRAIMPKVDPRWCEQILVVDGRSTDGTAEYARTMGYDVHVQREPGLRAAYREAWPLVRGEWVVTFSPDGNSPPEYIPQLIAKAGEGYDMVIASRYLDGAGSEDDDAVTAFGNWLFTSVINGLYRWHYTDAMTIFRIYRKELFYALDLDQDAHVPALRDGCSSPGWGSSRSCPPAAPSGSCARPTSPARNRRGSAASGSCR